LKWHFRISKVKTLNFDMDALRTMVVGLDLGGFSHAAVRLNRSPSAVSMQLRKLERQAGQRLFKRSGRGLVLTQAGELLLQHARRVLALNDEMGLALGAIDNGGIVRVGISQDFADTILQRLLVRYARVRPATQVEVRAGRTCGLADEVANGRIDIALAWAPMGQGAGERIARVRAAWVGLAKGAKSVPRNRVVPLVIFDNPCFFRDMAIEALSRARLPWRLAMTTPSLAELWSGIRAGLGVTVRSALCLPSDLAVVPASAGLPALAPIDIVLYRTASLSAAAQEFRDILLEIATRECRFEKALVATRPKRRRTLQ
jgi:DNA-binding transcriptional LysR family regulator